MSPALCARKLGVSATYVLRAIHSGHLAAIRTDYASGRRRFQISQAQLDEYQRKHKPIERRSTAA